MSKPTSPNKEKSKTEVSTAKEDENEELRTENLALRDLINLKDEAYYRQNLLSILGRIANALEESLESSDDDETDEKN